MRAKTYKHAKHDDDDGGGEGRKTAFSPKGALVEGNEQVVCTKRNKKGWKNSAESRWSAAVGSLGGSATHFVAATVSQKSI